MWVLSISIIQICKGNSEGTSYSIEIQFLILKNCQNGPVTIWLPLTNDSKNMKYNLTKMVQETTYKDYKEMKET